MAWTQRGPRKGARRLPERLRQKVIRRDRALGRGCYFGFPDICTGLTGRIEVHHVIDAEDGGADTPDNCRAACRPCHVRHSARQSQKRVWDFQRKPERHPGLI